mgnify:CR=1 FL=1
MDTIDNKKLDKYVIPNASKLSQTKGSDIQNINKDNNEQLLEEYMKNIISNTGCTQKKFTNNAQQDNPIQISQLLQIIKLNELKLIIQKMDLLDNINLKK